MYLSYVSEVLKRAFTATPRMTDAMQILAASALPAVSTAFGVELPQDAPTMVLAYIGMAALAFSGIRLLWAPYAIWSEQTAQIGALKLELTKPERLIMEHLALHRAKARAKLAGLLENFQSLAFVEEWNEWCVQQAASQLTKIRKIEAEAGLCQAYTDLRGRLLVIIQKEGDTKNADLPLDRDSAAFLKLLQRYLVGELTDEGLARLLPPYTELERQR